MVFVRSGSVSLDPDPADPDPQHRRLVKVISFSGNGTGFKVRVGPFSTQAVVIERAVVRSASTVSHY